ncbi:type II toxin-antitoxin system VapC family toxin [Rosistilla oblonga]|uniref:type II toxin-antitoxin system VapC family toxin n=1 Tax=Rosistilla oblonga TaxID=2527990 RepID=UPI003A97FE18
MTIVVDSSAIVALGLADEDAFYAEAVLERLAIEPAAAPMLFWYELRNVMLQGERRNRISRIDVDLFLGEFNRLAIAMDTTPDESDVLRLARKHGLTSYDASYLELAIRMTATMATLDKRLRDAALAELVPVLPNP